MGRDAGQRESQLLQMVERWFPRQTVPKRGLVSLQFQMAARLRSKACHVLFVWRHGVALKLERLFG